MFDFSLTPVVTPLSDQQTDDTDCFTIHTTQCCCAVISGN